MLWTPGYRVVLLQVLCVRCERALLGCIIHPPFVAGAVVTNLLLAPFLVVVCVVLPCVPRLLLLLLTTAAVRL